MVTVDRVWRAHQSDLRRYVRRRVADPHDANEIDQDDVVKAQESLRQLDSEGRAAEDLAVYCRQST